MKTETDFPAANDTRIRATAWALDQLTPEETTAFEVEMAADPDLAAYAGEMRQFSGLLSAGFPASDESGQLPEASRDRVVEALSHEANRPLHRGFLKKHWKSIAITTAAAAGIILTLRPQWINEPAHPGFSAGKAGVPSGLKQLASMDDSALKSRVNPGSSAPHGWAEENFGRVFQPGDIITYGDSDPSQSNFRKLQDSPTPLSKSLFSSAVSPLPAGLTTATGNTPHPSSRRTLSLASTTGGTMRGSMGLGISPDYNWSFRLPPASDDLRDSMLRESQADSYKNLPVNTFHEVTSAPLSTFSIDVDTASYANVRRFLNEGQRPPADAVRLEELVNYFPYGDAPPQEGKPFAVRVEMTTAPWNPAHRLARISLKGKEIATAQRPASNLVFLVDVSSSMNTPDRLPLVQQSLRMLTERLTENDRVSLVTYAGSTAVVLPSTNGQEKTRILAAIEALSSGGSTNGAGGITLAYQQAAAHFIKDGVNRVILATDGDFNVGVTSHEALLELIQEKAKTGVFLSVLGYGRGNLKDDTMELLADKGNGNYGYIDSLSEARKTLVEQMSGTLVTIAKDVKIQIEFNPAAVKSYRLLGYENRMLAKEDFNNDKKDAGEIGAGHNVTALYEIITAGTPDATSVPVVDGLKYQQVPPVTAPKPEPTPSALNGELMNVKLRWKQPTGDISELLEVPVKDTVTPFEQASQETRWSAAVAAFAQRLRGDATPTLTWDQIRQLARGAKGTDALGYRGEFLQLIDKAESVSP